MEIIVIKFDYINLTGLSEETVLENSRDHVKYMNDRFGEEIYTLQEAVDSVIAAAVEYNQGA